MVKSNQASKSASGLPLRRTRPPPPPGSLLTRPRPPSAAAPPPRPPSPSAPASSPAAAARTTRSRGTAGFRWGAPQPRCASSCRGLGRGWVGGWVVGRRWVGTGWVQGGYEAVEGRRRSGAEHRAAARGHSSKQQGARCPAALRSASVCTTHGQGRPQAALKTAERILRRRETCKGARTEHPRFVGAPCGSRKQKKETILSRRRVTPPHKQTPRQQPQNRAEVRLRSSIQQRIFSPRARAFQPLRRRAVQHRQRPFLRRRAQPEGDPPDHPRHRTACRLRLRMG